MVITGIWAEKKAIQQLNTQKRFPFWYIWIAALLDFAMSFVWLFAGLAGLEFSYEFLDFYLEFVALVIFPVLFVLNRIIPVYLRGMFLEHEGKGTDLANQIVTYLLAFFLGAFYLQYLINQQKAGDEVLEEDTLPGEEEGWKKVLKKINGYNVMAAVTLLVKFVVTYNIILLLPDLSSRITVVILFVFLWSPFGIASLLWAVVSLMLRKKKTGAWILIGLNVLDTIVLFAKGYFHS